MYLTLPAPSAAAGPTRAFHVVRMGFGTLPADSLALSGEDASAQSLKLFPVADALPEGMDEVRNLVLVAFQFGIPDDQRPSAMRAYVDARQPALERHGGRLLLSALSGRNDQWEYDGFELLDFPQPDGVQALMGDDDYRARTKQAASVFSGKFAMGVLAAA